MTVEDNVIHELVAELEASSDYRQRRGEIRAFNAASPVLKKGLALTPVKFGISFNVVHYNQAGALVHVYTDGSVLVSHGGTEMGQGLNTKVAQVVAHELGIGLKHVRSTAADTSKVANTSATAASTGSDLNGKAGQDAARQIRHRLARVRRGNVRRPRRGRRVRRRRGQRRGQGHRVPRARAAGVSRARPALVRRLLRDAEAPLGRPHDERPAVLLFRVRCRGVGGRRRHADRRIQAAARRPAARCRRLHQSGDRHRAGRRRLHPGHGLAHDRRALVERGRRADDPCAVDVQDPGGQRLPRRFPHEALQEQQRRGHDPALEGHGRAAAAACRSRCSSRSATRSRASATIASIRRSTRRRPARPS